MRYMRDGSPISAKIHIAEKRPNEHRSIFGLYRGVIIKVVYPDDDDNSNGERVEYVVKVKGQEYPNAVSMRDIGGIYNYSERIKKGVEKAYTGEISDGTFDENVDGEVVYVMFLEGHGDVPIILGSAQHPRQDKSFEKSDKMFDVEEYNGIEFKTDKDGNYTISSVGIKSADGKITNKDAVGTEIKIDGKNGDFSVTTPKDAKIKFKAVKDGYISLEGPQVFLLKENATDPAVLGKELKDMLDQMFTKLADQDTKIANLASQDNIQSAQLTTLATNIAAHVHNIITPIPGNPVGPPVNAAAFAAAAALFTSYATQFATLQSQFTQLQADFDQLKQKFVTTEDTNILSQKVFLERK